MSVSDDVFTADPTASLLFLFLAFPFRRLALEILFRLFRYPMVERPILECVELELLLPASVEARPRSFVPSLDCDYVWRRVLSRDLQRTFGRNMAMASSSSSSSPRKVDRSSLRDMTDCGEYGCVCYSGYEGKQMQHQRRHADLDARTRQDGIQFRVRQEP